MSDASPQPAPVDDDEAPRPKLPGLFTQAPYGVLAAIAATSAAIGLASLGLEFVFMRVLGDPTPPGTALGLPIPFVSMPLGLAALIATLLVARARPKLAIFPGLASLLYWGAVFYVI